MPSFKVNSWVKYIELGIESFKTQFTYYSTQFISQNLQKKLALQVKFSLMANFFHMNIFST